jgi:hypothetical protein
MVVDEGKVEGGSDERSVTGAEASSVDGTSEAVIFRVFAFLAFLSLRGAAGRAGTGSFEEPGTGATSGVVSSGVVTFCESFLVPPLLR